MNRLVVMGLFLVTVALTQNASAYTSMKAPNIEVKTYTADGKPISNLQVYYSVYAYQFHIIGGDVLPGHRWIEKPKLDQVTRTDKNGVAKFKSKRIRVWNITAEDVKVRITADGKLDGICNDQNSEDKAIDLSLDDSTHTDSGSHFRYCQREYEKDEAFLPSETFTCISKYTAEEITELKENLIQDCN